MNDKHYAEIEPAKGVITVTMHDTGEQIAKSESALKLLEFHFGKVFPPVFYIPRDDVDLSLLTKNKSHSTHCPIKGDASYYSSKDGPENVAWSYEDPLTQVRLIKGYLAFDGKLTRLSRTPG